MDLCVNHRLSGVFIYHEFYVYFLAGESDAVNIGKNQSRERFLLILDTIISLSFPEFDKR
jgi:hypothetical protein